MKIWKIPEEHKKKLIAWSKIREDWERGFDMVEMITGIIPKSINNEGLFQFSAEVKKLPNGLKKDDKGIIKINLSARTGRNMQAVWDKAEIPDISIVAFMKFFFGKKFDEFTYKTDLVNKEIHLIDHYGFEPGEFGYEEVEI